MRARSTEASVCPARTSTPPLRARSVYTCPGRARSSGFVCGSVAVRIVVARSHALVPVVVPRRASIGSQKGVPNMEVFRGEIGFRSSASQRCSESDMQISPRPNFAMKLMASGVIFSAAIVRSPSFSRSSSSTSTIMRPWRISSTASSIVANGSLFSLILVGPTGSFHYTESPSDGQESLPRRVIRSGFWGRSFRVRVTAAVRRRL